MTADEDAFDPSEYDVTITRIFEAPREQVWAAWTDPEQVAEWWGPKGFTVPRCEMDVRPGGAFRIDMEAPDGTVYPSDGVFEEVEEPGRFVLVGRAVEDDDGDYQMEVRQTVTFADRDGRTELRLEAEVVAATSEAAEQLEGMEVGWSESLEKLAGYVETRSENDETETETTDTSLVVRRTFDAPRERVYRAFTVPEELESWFGPGAMTSEVHALEPEPDGAYSVSMLDDENRYDVEGRFLEVVENERLVHTWEPGRVTIELRDVDDGTEVVLTHEGLPDRETADGHAAGWASALENLAEVL